MQIARKRENVKRREKNASRADGPSNGPKDRRADNFRYSQLAPSATRNFPATFYIRGKLFNEKKPDEIILFLATEGSNPKLLRAKATGKTIALLREMKESDAIKVLQGTFCKDNVLNLLEVEKTKTQAKKPPQKRKFDQFSVPIGEPNNWNSLETQTVSFESIDFSKYTDKSQHHGPLKNPLKLLFLGATDSLSSIEKPDIVWKKARFLDVKNLDSDGDGINQEIRVTVFNLQLLQGLTPGMVSYFERVTPTVYQKYHQLKFTNLTKCRSIESKETNIWSGLKALTLDDIVKNDFPVSVRVNVIGVMIQKMIAQTQVTIGSYTTQNATRS